MTTPFILDLSRFRIKTENQMRLVVKKFALELFTLIVRRSPVDTGRFRANNQIDINRMSPESVLEFKETDAGAVIKFSGGGVGGGGNVIARESSKLAEYELGDTIFIYNNVEYAIALEYGSSNKAPAGVYRISIQDIITFFDSMVRSVG